MIFPWNPAAFSIVSHVWLPKGIARGRLAQDVHEHWYILPCCCPVAMASILSDIYKGDQCAESKSSNLSKTCQFEVSEDFWICQGLPGASTTLSCPCIAAVFPMQDLFSAPNFWHSFLCHKSYDRWTSLPTRSSALHPLNKKVSCYCCLCPCSRGVVPLASECQTHASLPWYYY